MTRTNSSASASARRSRADPKLRKLELDKVRSMRTWIIALAVAITAAAGGIAIPIHPAAAQAAQNVPLVVGIVDVQEILNQSKAGQSLEKALRSPRARRSMRRSARRSRSCAPGASSWSSSAARCRRPIYQAKMAALEKEFDSDAQACGAKRKDWSRPATRVWSRFQDARRRDQRYRQEARPDADHQQVADGAGGARTGTSRRRSRRRWTPSCRR